MTETQLCNEIDILILRAGFMPPEDHDTLEDQLKRIRDCISGLLVEKERLENLLWEARMDHIYIPVENFG